MSHYSFPTCDIDIANNGITIRQLSKRKNKKGEHIVDEIAFMPPSHITGVVLIHGSYKIEIYNTNGEMTTSIKMPSEYLGVVFDELVQLVKAEGRK